LSHRSTEDRAAPGTGPHIGPSLEQIQVSGLMALLSRIHVD
jgi:hypothetical protein